MRFNEVKAGRRANIEQHAATERGFTLIETTIAMVVMMIAALGVASLFTYSIQFSSGGDDRAMAMSIAQQQIEQVRSVTFSDAILNTTTTSGTVLSPDTVSNGRTYQVTRTVTGSNNNASGTPTLKTITIRVDPRSPGWAGFPVILRTVRSANSTGAY
ncbi:MAG: prepilin-type N-terminal cleavage/methylation domain-containing protein [bacterium]